MNACSRRATLGVLGGVAVAPLLAAGAAHGADDAFRRIAKAAWVWRIDLPGLPRLGDFAAVHGISRLALAFREPEREALLGGASSALRDGVQALRSRGIAVVALTGDPEWPRRPRLMPRSLATLIEIQRRHRVFDGLHLDVEPHSLADWRAGGAARTALMVGMIGFVETVRRAAPGWPLEAAVHPQYARLTLPSAAGFMQELIARTDAVALMAYRDDPARQLRFAGPSIDIFERARKPWRLGVLVHADKEKGVSYWGRGRGAVLAAAADLDRLIRTRSGGAPAYRGLMFEHAAGLAAMLER